MEFEDHTLFEEHILFLNKHCRICGLLLARNCKGRKATTYFVDDDLKHEDLQVSWARILMDLNQFAIDIFSDHPQIHPSEFCRSCYNKITTVIKRPDYLPQIQLFRFERHNFDVSECIICKQHLARPRGGPGRPPKVKRGRRTVAEKEAAASAANLATYPLPESIQLAQVILAKKSEARKCSLSDPLDTKCVLQMNRRKRTVDQATSPIKPPMIPIKAEGVKLVKKKKLSEMEFNGSEELRLRPYWDALYKTAAEQGENLEEILPDLGIYLDNIGKEG